MKHLPAFLLALLAAAPFACSSNGSSVTGAGTGGSAAHASSASAGTGATGGMGGMPFAGPPAWNRMVTPPSDGDATAKRAACGYEAGSLPAETQGASYPSGKDIPVDHILVVMMENRSFDHYFWKLPEHGQTDVEVAPSGYTNPDGMGGAVAPYHDHQYCLVDTDHSWAGTHQAYNGGKMDGFFLVNNGGASPPPNGPPNATSGQRALAYYDDTDVPFYYWLANEFSLADHYHCALLGPTFPNRMYMYSATSRGNVGSSLSPCVDEKGSCNTDADCGGAPGSCVAEGIGASCKGSCKVDADCGIDVPPGTCDVAGGGACKVVGRTIFDYMEQRHMSWKVYASGTPGYGVCVSTFLQYHGTNQFSIADYMADAAAGTLPDVAFVDPDLGNEYYGGEDEHPPGMPQGGQHFVAKIVDALMKSPAWPRSALFFTYDEHGGYWDHIAPPSACPPDDIAPILMPGDPVAGFDRYGVRVPMMVISPYAKKHHVSHQTYDHTSILRFIQARFVLPAMTNRDANALAPWDMFDFQSPPHATPPAVTVPPIDQAGQDACAVIWTAPDAGADGG